eukprot:gene11446-13305_t
MFFYGCICHGLHLIVEKLLKGGSFKEVDDVVVTEAEEEPNTTAAVEAEGEDAFDIEVELEAVVETVMVTMEEAEMAAEVAAEVEEDPSNPFAFLVKLAANNRAVVKCFKNHTILWADLKVKQLMLKLVHLLLSAATRWGTNTGSMQATHDSYELIESIVRVSSWLSPGYVLEKSAKTKRGKPLDIEIKAFQSNSVSLSEAYACFLRQKAAYKGLLWSEQLTVAQEKRIQSIILARWNMLYSDAHGVAYVLDPRYNGADMSGEDKDDVEEYISEYTAKEEDESIRMLRYKEYTSFTKWVRDHKARYSVQYAALYADGDARQTILEFWQTRGTEWPLVQPLALRVFSLCATSCESERAFSCLGFIHSKLRNRLSPEKANMLAFIKANDEILDNIARIDGDCESDFDIDEDSVV